jgi:hypothetical protein
LPRKSLREYTLRAISDDYEEFERVLRDVTAFALQEGTTADRHATVTALEQLIADGYAQAYVLSAEPPGKAEAVAYSPSRLTALWFYVTPKGKQAARNLWQDLESDADE